MASSQSASATYEAIHVITLGSVMIHQCVASLCKWPLWCHDSLDCTFSTTSFHCSQTSACQYVLDVCLTFNLSHVLSFPTLVTENRVNTSDMALLTSPEFPFYKFPCVLATTKHPTLQENMSQKKHMPENKNIYWHGKAHAWKQEHILARNTSVKRYFWITIRCFKKDAT